MLIWDNDTRAQLLEFLLGQQRQHVRSGESDPSYGATYVHQRHADELVIGGIFVRVYNSQVGPSVPDKQSCTSSKTGNVPPGPRLGHVDRHWPIFEPEPR